MSTRVFSEEALEACMKERMSVKDMAFTFGITIEDVYRQIGRAYQYGNAYAAYYAAELTTGNMDVLFTNRRQAQMIMNLLTQKNREAEEFAQHSAYVLDVLDRADQNKTLPQRFQHALESLLLMPKDPAATAARLSSELRGVNQQYMDIQAALYQHNSLATFQETLNQLVQLSERWPVEVRRELRSMVEQTYLKVLGDKQYMAIDQPPPPPVPVQLPESPPQRLRKGNEVVIDMDAEDGE